MSGIVHKAPGSPFWSVGFTTFGVGIAKRFPKTSDNTLSACFVHTSQFTEKVIRFPCPASFLYLRVFQKESTVFWEFLAIVCLCDLN